MPTRVAIFVTRADDTALRLAGSCALSAAATGDQVDVYVFGPAVAALVAAREDPDHAGARLCTARGARVRLLACSASVVEERVAPSEAEAAFDAVVGWATVIEWTRGVVERFSF